ncbi:MAG: HlyD family secretion protein [Bacteroidota bacterium]
MENQISDLPKKKIKWKVYIPLTLVIMAVVLLGALWYRNYTKYFSTDDAYVESDDVAVSAKIIGRILTEYAEEGDSVKKGMLLAVLDSTDMIAQANQAISMKDQAIATMVQTKASYSYDEQAIKVLQVNLNRAKEDYDRAKTQYQGNVITKETYDHLTKTYEAAQAQMNASNASLAVSKAKIGSSASAIKSAEAQVALVQTQLRNTRLYAPMDGIIAKRWLLPGDIATTGQSIFTITNNEKYWIIVYMEETNISRIHIGQKATFKIDAYSGVNFIGKVFSIGSNTASQFSLIPPNNASGNFTKVTQRVPLKISIDGTETDEKIGMFKFLTGMSAEVKIFKE